MMRSLFLFALLQVALSAGPVMAGEIPPFLAGGQKYATAPANCTDATGSETGLSISAAGMFGRESGSSLLASPRGRDDARPEPIGYVAIASCGDDSGISRPDMLNISLSEGGIYVTSQSDYTIAASRPFDGRTDPFAKGIIEERFELCR